ncbi:MAG: Fe-S cluster assembly ATPase SufC [Candidatus Woykebacteria bacterium GWB1_45_5]|uniref:Fe-S cluster assembly ATPase SufC n=1 Tax=Candidatus Woykebacteria bacterium GWB1_45_5 TaxID=1802592 RepID=A0A1G1WBD2_9BACT|nr:MAG: Fe-S cluster assembly ATPase SufC [Candidatus Woykebacteria bacterium GWB1_45_5]
MFEIRDLHVWAANKEIIRGISLKIKSGEIHVLMGPNGSGKSSLALALAGHPRYKITSGLVKLDEKEINKLSPDKRAKAGLFLALQYPTAVPGVSTASLLRASLKNQKQNVAMPEFFGILKTNMNKLKIDESFASRSINDGFSGGEKKKSEILQLSVLKPKYAILDEVDSGLDIDSLKLVAKEIKKTNKSNVGVLLITHYQRILKYISPDKVHVLVNGEIVESGGKKIAAKLETKGYTSYVKTTS